MFKKSVVSTTYCIELSIEEMLKVLNNDTSAEDDEDEELLVEELASIDGVFDVDYNGHFGPVVYLALEDQHDTEDIWEEIFACIKNSINRS